MTDQSALRCSTCGVSWPTDLRNYAKCPQCGEKTDRINNETPMDAKEAMSIKSHREFESYCEKRDALKKRELDQLEAQLTDVTGAGPNVQRTQTGLPRPPG